MAFDLIQRITLPSSNALVEFDTLPTTYKDLRIMVSARATNTATRTVFFIRVNNDSTNTNYTQFDWYFEDTSSGAEWATSGTRTRIIGIVPAVNATSSYSHGVADIWVNNYNNSTNYKQIHSLMCSYQTSAPNWDNWNNGVVWENTNAITKISFEPEAGSFAAGSTFHLYGLK